MNMTIQNQALQSWGRVLGDLTQLGLPPESLKTTDTPSSPRSPRSSAQIRSMADLATIVDMIQSTAELLPKIQTAETTGSCSELASRMLHLTDLGKQFDSLDRSLEASFKKALASTTSETNVSLEATTFHKRGIKALRQARAQLNLHTWADSQQQLSQERLAKLSEELGGRDLSTLINLPINTTIDLKVGTPQYFKAATEKHFYKLHSDHKGNVFIREIPKSGRFSLKVQRGGHYLADARCTAFTGKATFSSPRNPGMSSSRECKSVELRLMSGAQTPGKELAWSGSSTLDMVISPETTRLHSAKTGITYHLSLKGNMLVVSHGMYKHEVKEGYLNLKHEDAFLMVSAPHERLGRMTVELAPNTAI